LLALSIGSTGVSRQCFRCLADEDRRTHFDLFKLFNDSELREAVTAAACSHYGYESHQVEWRLYAGKFAGGHKADVRSHLANLTPPVVGVGLDEIVETLVGLAGRPTYTDDPVIMTVKALAAAGRLTLGDEVA
jgi:hypothetical protein